MSRTEDQTAGGIHLYAVGCSGNITVYYRPYHIFQFPSAAIGSEDLVITCFRDIIAYSDDKIQRSIAGIPVAVIAATVFWIMLMMNSINFFDNMDGLAAGVIAIALGIFAVIAELNGQFFIAAISALSCGVCCGFWFYNMAPAKIFMGDSGSHFLGFLAAVTAAEISFFDVSYSLSRFPVLIPLLVLALPLFDTAMVVVIRTLNKKPFWIGDHNHISHRFVRMGMSRPLAVLLVHLLSLSIGITALPIFWGDFRTAAILVFQALLQLTVVTILQFTLAKKE